MEMLHLNETKDREKERKKYTVSEKICGSGSILKVFELLVTDFKDRPSPATYTYWKSHV